jgi:hypothetical protein
MKKHMKKIISLCVVLTLLASLLVTSASAWTWDNVEETNYASRYTSSYYTYGKFYENMTRIPLTGDGARDVVAVALTQSTYLEADSSSGQDGETGGSSNMTEYGAYTNVNGAAWCASFCSWCIYTAEVTDIRGTESYMARNEYYWSECYVPYWSQFLDDQGRYEYAAYYGGSYKPQPGDLIFFTYYNTPLDEDHIGLVVYSDNSYVYTIEGNTSSQDGLESEGGGVFFKKYSLSSSTVAGYGRLPYKTVSDLPAIDYSGENPTEGLYINPSAAVAVYQYKEDSTARWTLPACSVFEVSKIEKDSLGYTMLYSKCEIGGVIVNGWICLGSGSNGLTRTVQVYAAPEKKGIESDVYEVTDEDVVKNISAGTTVRNFVTNITTEGSVKVYDNKGTALSNTDNLGTGYTVQVLDGSEVIKTYTLVVKGDVNGDTKISAIDYAKIKRHVLKANQLEGVYYDAGSLVKENKVTAYDYIMVKRYVLGQVKF